MLDDFCAFILTHGRPDRVYTYKTLLRAGYTGKIYIVIDDEDKTADEYRARFGDKVLQFCKTEMMAVTDDGDNFDDRRGVIYARNACWDLARRVGCKYFIQLDDDYLSFFIRFRDCGVRCSVMIQKNMDEVLLAMLEFFSSIPCLSVAMAQGGDWQGGQIVEGSKLTGGNKATLRRKAMNSFICSTEKRFAFVGRINEDVNTYVGRGRCGDLFFTVMQAQLVQKPTQSNAGGMTDLYLDGGTYVKTFYSVMYAPSCVKVGQMGDPKSPHYRIHHKINWHRTVPKILAEQYKK
ncbi:MAG: hypothetical protein PHW59_13510 [Desulfobacterales bacterium]|jgi:hypothetical protein|nr:hypothetical protein [Desulfobacterales bacterium]